MKHVEVLTFQSEVPPIQYIDKVVDVHCQKDLQASMIQKVHKTVEAPQILK